MLGEITLKDFIEQLGPKANFKKYIVSQCKDFEIIPRELTKMTPKAIMEMQNCILQERRESNEEDTEEWTEVEKKLVNWVLLCYLSHHHKTAMELNDSDYQLLSQITTNKPVPLLKYYVKSSLKQQKRPKWTEEEDRILHQILAVQRKYSPVGMWSAVSRELFLRGDHIQYKPGKICRERWYNYVNPSLVKQWTLEEDLNLLKSVRIHGKKWSSLIPRLNNTKSEHMIKNRYYSLLRKEKTYSLQNEDETVIFIISQLTQLLAQETYQKNIEALTVKDERTWLVRSNSIDQPEEKPEVSKKQEDSEMFMIRSNLIGNINNSTNLDEDRLDYKMLQLIKEDSPIQNEQIKVNKEFNPYESLRFTIASPLPLTPVPPTLLTSMQPSPLPEAQTSFTSKFQQFSFHVRE